MSNGSLPLNEPQSQDESHESTPSTDVGIQLEETAARNRVRLRNHHWLMLSASTLIVILACLLQIRSDQRVQLRWGPEIPLPEACVSKVYFGIECPGCGLTRSFISLTRGDIWQAWSLNRFSWLLAIALVAQFPYRVWSLWRLEQQRVPIAAWPEWIGFSLVALLLGNWGLKMCGI